MKKTLEFSLSGHIVATIFITTAKKLKIAYGFRAVDCLLVKDLFN